MFEQLIKNAIVLLCSPRDLAELSTWVKLCAFLLVLFLHFISISQLAHACNKIPTASA